MTISFQNNNNERPYLISRRLLSTGQQTNKEQSDERATVTNKDYKRFTHSKSAVDKIRRISRRHLEAIILLTVIIAATSMVSLSTSNKQTRPTNTSVNPPSPNKARRKKARTETQGDTEMSDVEDTDEIFIDDGFIDTSINRKLFDLQKYLPADRRDEAKTAFLGEIGEGPNFLHDPLRRNRITVARIIQKKRVINTDILSTQGLSKEQWMLTLSEMATDDKNLKDFEDAVSEEELVELKVFMSRLSYTPPTQLFHVTASKTPSTDRSRAWYGAKMTLGSNYKVARTIVDHFGPNPKTGKEKDTHTQAEVLNVITPNKNKVTPSSEGQSEGNLVDSSNPGSDKIVNPYARAASATLTVIRATQQTMPKIMQQRRQSNLHRVR